MICNSPPHAQSRFPVFLLRLLAKTPKNRFSHSLWGLFPGVIWQYVPKVLKVRACFDPAVPSGTDPKETAEDVHRDLIISVFTQTLLMIVEKQRERQCLTIGLVNISQWVTKQSLKTLLWNNI